MQREGVWLFLCAQVLRLSSTANSKHMLLRLRTARSWAFCFFFTRRPGRRVAPRQRVVSTLSHPVLPWATSLPLSTLHSLSSQIPRAPHICATVFQFLLDFPSIVWEASLPHQDVLLCCPHLSGSGALCPQREAQILPAPPGAALLSHSCGLPGGQLVRSATQSSLRHLAQSLSSCAWG